MDNGLTHHGILGMKWGVRRTPEQLGHVTIRQASKNAKKAGKEAVKESVRKMNESPKKHTLAQYNRAAKKAKKEAIKESIEKDRKLNKSLREAKLSRKYDIAKTYQDIKSQTSLKDKLIYNNATRKKAAKYVVDNNMSVADATKKAKGDAWRNTAALLTVYGAVTVYSLTNRHGRW